MEGLGLSHTVHKSFIPAHMNGITLSSYLQQPYLPTKYLQYTLQPQRLQQTKLKNVELAHIFLPNCSPSSTNLSSAIDIMPQNITLMILAYS